MTMTGFPTEPETTDEVRWLHAEDVDELRFVMNSTGLWGRAVHLDDHHSSRCGATGLTAPTGR